MPRVPVSSDEEWTPENVHKGAVASQVRSDTQKLDDVFQLVKRRISMGQDKRRKNTKSSMNRPFKIGEGARTRLTATERKDGENPTGRVKQRHFNEIEPAPQQILSRETKESGDSIDN